MIFAAGGVVVTWLIRLAAYGLSGYTVWNFLQGQPGHLPSGRLLTLDTENGMLFGVCAGISHYTGIDVSLIRMVWVLAVLYKGLGILLYGVAFLLIPLS